MEIIGLSGYARSGKDEAAKVLVKEFGFKRVAFADKLREFLYALNPMIDMNRRYSPTEPDGPPIYVQEVINKYTWDGYKETPFGPEIRRLLQRLGTEAGRNTMWDSIWIDAAFAPYKNGNHKIVVTDVRFPNEARAIQDMGGQIWRVKREGVGPANNHPSETSLDNWRFDGYLNNWSDDINTWYASVAKTYETKRHYIENRF